MLVGWRSRVLAISVVGLCLSSMHVSAGPAAPASYLTFDELGELYREKVPPAPLQKKLDDVLETPVVDNGAWDSGVRPRVPVYPRTGRTLRVAQWNIERGIEFDTIVAVFQGAKAFEPFVDDEQYPKNGSARAELLEEADRLVDADVVVLNEVDWGLARSEYHNVAADLGKALGMNYAYGVEFVEVDPYATGAETLAGLTPHEKTKVVEESPVDQARTRALHGTAILSRYRIENVRVHRFRKQGHDWYNDEREGVSQIERGKRTAGELAFLEKVSREVRRGGRMAVFADIVDESLPTGRVSIVATHLENRTTPSTRVDQLEEILAEIRPLPQPVLFVGDMNTTGSDATPTSLRYMIKRKLGSKSFWSKEALTYATGLGLVLTAPLATFKYFDTYRDPTRRGLPLIAPNRERKFFSTLEEFRFADGGAFDFGGDSKYSSNGLSGTLANSNERAVKGFATTWRTERTIGPSGKMKLDWIFVKPAGRLLAPQNGTTLRDLNYSTKDRISDHNPIFADLPLGDVPAPTLRRQ